MKILELSKQYFVEIAEPLLKQDFPHLYPRLAIGLVGNGSECFGYDDSISLDHDCGVEFYLWTTEEDRAVLPALNNWKAKLFEQYPPCIDVEYTQYRKPVAAMTVSDFYQELLGISKLPQTIEEWIRAPEENFALATNGAVWVDECGEFSHTRRVLLSYYPEDIRKKRLAAACMEISQTGQYNNLRMGKRGDWVAVRLSLAHFCEAVLSLVFMLNKVYKPYYKWAYRMFTCLPILGKELSEPLTRIALFSHFEMSELVKQQEEIDALCGLLVKELIRQGLVSSTEPFMAVQGEEIQQSIESERLRNLPAHFKI